MVDKLSIASEMRAIDTKDRNWYKTLDDEERTKYNKQLWIQQRWASSVQGSNVAQYLILVNDYSNVNFNLLAKHPELQLQSLQIAGVGKTQKHDWMPPGKKGKKNKLAEWLVTQYPECNDDELMILAVTGDKKEFRDMMEQQGMKPKEIKELLKK